jgi:uncharacterized phage-associated protein
MQMFTSGDTNKKLKNAIIYFIKQDKTVKLTKLMKLLYYLDFLHYQETGYSITGQEYAAWPKGPVPKDVWAEINKDQDCGCGLRGVIKTFPAQQDDFGYDLKIIGKQSFSDECFSRRELRRLKEVSEIFKEVPAKLMIAATHMPGQPWEKTLKEKYAGAVIDYDLALDGISPDIVAEIKEEQADRRAIERVYGALL